MKNIGIKTFKIFLIFCAINLLSFSVFAPIASAAFRFVAWGDSRGNNAQMSKISNQIKAMPQQPNFTIFSGDLVPTNGTGTATDKFNAWKVSVSGGVNNGMFEKTFAIRGNHDLPDTAAWTNIFQFGPETNPSSVAAKVGGVSNFQSLNEDLTYSFDYQNSHFVGVDVPGNANLMTSAQIAWVDTDLRSAAQRGLKHAFLFWHGPIYTVDGHMAPVPTAIVTMLDNHPIVTAVFFGHEHVLSHVTLNKAIIPQLTKTTIEEFVSGGAGAGFYSCTAGRSEICELVYGFMTIDVLNDTQIRSQFYKDGQTTPIYDKTFTKGQVGPTSPPGPTPTPGPVRTATPTAVPTRTPTTPPGGKTGDLNGDNLVNIIDIGIVIDNYGKSPIPNPKADINKDGKVDIIDIGIIVDNYGK